jgi:hypothetical protein
MTKKGQRSLLIQKERANTQALVAKTGDDGDIT